jgi:hypothetical protein
MRPNEVSVLNIERCVFVSFLVKKKSVLEAVCYAAKTICAVKDIVFFL